MSSSKKRRELTKANNARRDMASRLGGAESMAHMWEAGCQRISEEHKKVLVENDQLKRDNAALQAKIDALMLEYCPDEMTQAQLDNWAAHQKAVSPEEQEEINKIIDGSLKDGIHGTVS